MKATLINNNVAIPKSPVKQQLLLLFLFVIFLFAVQQIFLSINIREDSDMNYDEETETFYLDNSDLVDNGYVYIGNEWIIVPNVPNATLKHKGFSFENYKDMPYASRVEISPEYGWNDLGSIAEWNNCDSAPDLITFNEDGEACHCMLYIARLSVPENVSTLHLCIPRINGLADIYSNGKYIATVGNTYQSDVIDFTCGYQSIPLTSNYNNIIELVIAVKTFDRTVIPGIVSYPSLNITSSDYKSLVVSTIWIMFQVTGFIAITTFGGIISRTFRDKWKYYTFVMHFILNILFFALDSGFFVANSLTTHTWTHIFGVLLSVSIYGFISSLFNKAEVTLKHKLLQYDQLIIAGIGTVLVLIIFFSSIPNPKAPALISTIFSFVVIAICVIKTMFIYNTDSHSSIGLMATATALFSSAHMFSNDMLVYNIPAYSLFYILFVYIVIIAFVYEYLSQNKKLNELKEHLQYTVNEKTIHISEINRDLYNTNQQLIKNEEARKNVLSNVSHDLRTPITAIRGYAELLMVSHKTMSETQVETYLDNIIKRAQQMERIVSDIVELTRMESNASEFQFIELPLCELLDEIVMMYKCDLDGTTKSLELNIPDDDMLFVSADPKKLSRVFENLISNSINYTGEEANIVVTAWRSDDDKKIHVTISDDGIGIAANEIEHIFDRFYRAKNSGQNIKGTGLGLSIVKTIIDHHKATITVESTLGVGTTFHIVMTPAE